MGAVFVARVPNHDFVNRASVDNNNGGLLCKKVHVAYLSGRNQYGQRFR